MLWHFVNNISHQEYYFYIMNSKSKKNAQIFLLLLIQQCLYLNNIQKYRLILYILYNFHKHLLLSLNTFLDNSFLLLHKYQELELGNNQQHSIHPYIYFHYNIDILQEYLFYNTTRYYTFYLIFHLYNLDHNYFLYITHQKIHFQILD